MQTDDYEVVAGSMVLPISVPNDRVDAVLHTILSEAISAEEAQAINERQLTQDGIPGVEIHATVQDGYAARFLDV